MLMKREIFVTLRGFRRPRTRRTRVRTPESKCSRRLPGPMSENGPREGTKDLPRRDPESGRRSVEPDSASGQAYAKSARDEQRRRLEIRALAEQGLSGREVAASYERDHPSERAVTEEEVAEARDALPDRRPTLASARGA
jgi:hypothetical protein